ncbi:hypothetical protein BKA65DRAFT_550829 [Rhexocercosporidium sp. MPI-PUGE-AT-0058]|nr:hypothetical protein BKA65DRAFT_550829 [Rhexocercosporidium sp. MPI-PUGE-AT-0058]
MRLSSVMTTVLELSLSQTSSVWRSDTDFFTVPKNQSQDDLDEWENPRVVFELRQVGFLGDYKQPLLDTEAVKVNVASYRPLVEDSDADSQEGMLEIEMDPPNRPQGNFVVNTTSDDDENADCSVDDEGDSNIRFLTAYKYSVIPMITKYLIPTQGDEGYDTDQGSEGSDGDGGHDGPGTGSEIDEIDESQRFYTSSDALMHESPRIEPQEDTLEYPSKIGSRFQRAGLFYPIPAVNYQPGLNYFKKELKKACRDFH